MFSLKLSIFSLQILLLSLLLVRTTLASVHDEEGDKKEAGEASTAGEAGTPSKLGSSQPSPVGSAPSTRHSSGKATPAGSLSRGNSGILEPEAVGEVVGSDSHHSSAPNSKHPSGSATPTGSLSRGTSVGEPEGISGLEAEAGGIEKDKSGSSSSSSSSSSKTSSHSSKASSVNGTPKGSGEEKENAKSDHSSPKGLGSGHHTPGKSAIQATVPIESGSPSSSQGHFDPAVLKGRLEALENHQADGEALAEKIPITASSHSSGRSTPKGSGKLSRGPSGNHMLDRDGSDIVEKGDGGIGSGSHNSSNNSSKHSSKPASRQGSEPDSRHSSGTSTPNGTGPGEPYAEGFNSLKEANFAPVSPKLPSGHVSPKATGSGTLSRGNSGISESKAAEDFGAGFWKDDLFDEHPKSQTGSTHSSRPGSGNASPTVALSRGNSGKLPSHSGPPSSEQDFDLADALSGGGKYADPDMRSHHSSGQTTPNGSLSRSTSGHLSDAEGQKHVPSHSGHPSSENGFDLADALSGAGLHEAHAEMSGKVETMNDDGTSSQRSPHSSKTHSRNSSFGAGSVADSLADHAEDPTADFVHSATGHSVAIDEDGSQVLGNANREYIGSEYIGSGNGMPSGDEEHENGLVGNVTEERKEEEERMSEMDSLRVHDTPNAESIDGNMDDSMAGIGAENVEDNLANSDPEYVHGSPRARSLSSSSSGRSGSGRFNVRDVGNDDDGVDEPEPSSFDADELRATEKEGITSDDEGDSSPLHRSKPKLSVDIPKSSFASEDMVPNPSGSSQHNSPIGGHRSKHLNQEAVEEEGTPIGGPQHSPIHLLGGGSSHGSSHGSQAGSHGSHSQAGSAQASPTGSQAGSHHDSTAGEAKSRDDGSSSGTSTSPKDSPKSLGAVALGHSGSGRRFPLSPNHAEKNEEISVGGSANSSPRDSKPEAHLHGHAKSEDHAAEGTGKGTKTGHEDARFNDVVANDKRALEAFLKSEDHPAGENMNIFETAATRMEHDLLDCTNKSPKHDKNCVHWQLLQLAFVKWFKFVAAVESNPHNTEAYAQIAVRPNFNVKDANVHPKHNKPVPGTPGTVAQVMEITGKTYPAGKSLDIDNHKVLKFVTAKVDGHAKHASHPDGKMKSHLAGEADVLKKIFEHEKEVLAGQRVDFEDAVLKKALSKYKEPKDSGIVKMLLDFFTKMASYLKIGSSSPKGTGSALPQANPAAAGTAAHHSGLAHSPSRATHHTGAKPETHHHHAGAAVPATGGNSASSSPGAAAAAAHVHQHHQQKKQESPGSPAGHPHTPTGRR